MQLYIDNLQAALNERMGDDLLLSLLRSDGGLASGRAAADSPVNMLMSGPAGGVTGAVYFCSRAGFDDILTFDMGGTSTDVALIQNSKARIRRETFVGDVKVRAPSVDVRTVGSRRRFDLFRTGVNGRTACRSRVGGRGARSGCLHEGRRQADRL